MIKNECIPKGNRQSYKTNFTFKIQQKKLEHKNIDDDSLYNISYSSPKKENINRQILNDYLMEKKHQKNNYIKSNNNQKDERLTFCLRMLGLIKYHSIFLQNNINFEGLLALTNNDMTQMKIDTNAQVIIQNFILDYLYFGNQFSLEELKQYFLKKKSITNNNRQLKSNKRSYSYDCHRHKPKVNNVINSDINIGKVKNNNYISENDNNKVNKNLYINNPANKLVSHSNKNIFDIYSKINDNNFNINFINTNNNIQHYENSQYMLELNNKNNNYNNNNKSQIINNKYYINNNENVNIKKNYFFNPLNNINQFDYKGNIESSPNLVINKIKDIKRFTKINDNSKSNIKKKHNMIPNSHKANSTKNIINQLDQVILKNRKRKKFDITKINNSFDNFLNINKNNDTNYSNSSFGNSENNYKGYYSDNNKNDTRINNNVLHSYNNLTDFNQNNNYTNNTNNSNNNSNYSGANHSLLNNYELNSFYTGNTPKINTYKKFINDSDKCTQTQDKSLHNSKFSKIKMLKMNQMKEVNHLLENSNNKGRKIPSSSNINNNSYSISEKRGGMIMNNLNNYFIYNNYKTENRNDLNDKNNNNNNKSITMNNNNFNNSNLNIQNMEMKNKAKYLRNMDNLFYTNTNTDNNNNLNNINNTNNMNINTNVNNIMNYYGNNMSMNNRKINIQNINRKHQFLDMLTNSSLIQSEKRFDIGDEEKWNQFRAQKPKKSFNKNEKNIINIYKLNNRNGYLLNNYTSDFQSDLENNTTDNNEISLNNISNNIKSNISNINTNINNNMNTNINNINTNINHINLINNINNINNNMKLTQPKKNNINSINNMKNNSNINNMITPFHQYNKSSQNFYNKYNINCVHQNTNPPQRRQIANSAIKNRKSYQFTETSLINISNQPYIKSMKNVNKNSKKINLYKNMSKNQLEKLKIDIKKGMKLISNNNVKKNKNIKQNYYYSNTNNTVYNPNTSNVINPKNIPNYQNNQIKTNYYSNDNNNFNNNYF